MVGRQPERFALEYYYQWCGSLTEVSFNVQKEECVMWITTSFQSGETVSSGLSPTIRVRDVETGLVVASGTMDELGDGFYAYDFFWNMI